MTRRAVRLSPDGRVLTPRDVLEAAHLFPGEPIRFEVTDRGVLLRAIDPEQAWFWTPEWLEGESEADAAMASGDLVRFDSGEDLVAYVGRDVEGD